MDEKEQAVAYIKTNKIDIILQQNLNSLYKTKPKNVFGYLANKLEKFAIRPTVKVISGYTAKSLNNNNPRVVIELTCENNNQDEVAESAFIGNNDSDITMNLDDLKVINDTLQGSAVCDQEDVDKKLSSLEISPDMVLTVSLAILKSNARLEKTSLLQLLEKTFDNAVKRPIPFISIINCGKYGPGKNNVCCLSICPNDLNFEYSKGMAPLEKLYCKVEEMLKKKNTNNLPYISPNGGFSLNCDKPEQMFEIVKEAATESELAPGTDFYFVLDFLASDFHTEVVPGQGSAKKGQESKKDSKKSKRVKSVTQSASRHRYDWIEGQVKPTEDLCDFIESLVENEDIVAIIDPLHYEDAEGYEMLTKKLSHKCLIFSRHPTSHAGDVLKMNTTITHTVKQLEAMEKTTTILEAAAFEEGETVLADMAMASGCGFVMFGGLQGVRVNLYNKLLKVEQQQSKTSPALKSWGFKEENEEEAQPT